MIVDGIDLTKKFEKSAARYGKRAADFMEAAFWAKDFPVARDGYQQDAIDAANIAAYFAFAAHPELREPAA
jgi:hypothetical protein